MADDGSKGSNASSETPTEPWFQYLSKMEMFQAEFSKNYRRGKSNNKNFNTSVKNGTPVEDNENASHSGPDLALPTTNISSEASKSPKDTHCNTVTDITQHVVDSQLQTPQINTDDSTPASDDHSLDQPELSKNEVQPAESRSPAVCNLSKANSSSDEESNGSDEVVFRQDQHNMVGPRLSAAAFKQGQANDRKISAQAKENVNKGPAQQEVNLDRKGIDQPMGSSALTPKSNGRDPKKSRQPKQVVSTPKTKTPTKAVKAAANKKALDTQEELRKLQAEEMLKFGKKELGIETDDAPNRGPLFLARQGPGTDPNSPISQRFAIDARTALENPNLIQDTYKTDCGTDLFLDNKESKLTANKSDESDDRLKLTRQGQDPALVDWQYRPWQTYGDEHFVKFFRTWLENTMRLGYPVDTNDERFISGKFHADGVNGMTKPRFHVEDVILNPEDPQNMAHCHETAAGYAYNWSMRIDNEKAEQEKADQKRITQTPNMTVPVEEPNRKVPKVNIYIRPVEGKDIPALVALYNWYVRNTCRCVDLQEITQASMKEEILESEDQKFPFLVAVEQKRGFVHAMNDQDEMVYGYAIVCDFTGPESTQRYAGEVEVFVHPKNYRLGIGRCLLDKVVQMCDPKYTAKHGYLFDCAADKRGLYCAGGNRQLTRMIIIVHHPTDDVEDYEWIKGWLKREFEFEEQALLKGVGVKKKQLLNSGYLVRNTAVSL